MNNINTYAGNYESEFSDLPFFLNHLCFHKFFDRRIIYIHYGIKSYLVPVN